MSFCLSSFLLSGWTVDLIAGWEMANSIPWVTLGMEVVQSRAMRQHKSGPLGTWSLKQEGNTLLCGLS